MQILPKQDRQFPILLTYLERIQSAHRFIVANRCGHEPDPDGGPGADFWGNSFIAGPQGEILAQAGNESTILAASLDPQRAEDVRRIWPFLRDRRVDAYGGLDQRFLD